jgi:hypothetical protein
MVQMSGRHLRSYEIMKQNMGIVSKVVIQVFDKDGKLVTHKVKDKNGEKIFLEREAK